MVEVAQHIEGRSLTETNQSVFDVDAGRFSGKRVLLPGEISCYNIAGEVSRGHSSGAKPQIQSLTVLSGAYCERVAMKG